MSFVNGPFGTRPSGKLSSTKDANNLLCNQTFPKPTQCSSLAINSAVDGNVVERSICYLFSNFHRSVQYFIWYYIILSYIIPSMFLGCSQRFSKMVSFQDANTMQRYIK